MVLHMGGGKGQVKGVVGNHIELYLDHISSASLRDAHWISR